MPFAILRRAWSTIRYKHKPLGDAHRTIRLFTLHKIPHKDHGPIEVTIEEVPVNKLDQKNYVALSYTWRKHAQACMADAQHSYILVDGYYMVITENLSDFLKSKTAKECMDRGLPIFVDAICIDQTSNEEKERQLPLMSQIYENARRTVLWLGQSGPSNQLRRVNTGLGQNLQGLQSKVLAQLINNIYWERMWVVPELFLSNKIDIAVGDDTISWPDIACVTEWQDIDKKNVVNKVADTQRLGAEDQEKVARRLEAMIQTVEAKTKWDKEIYNNREENVNSQTCLLELLQRFRDRQCADERDRVYALLPLVPDCQIPVNYDQSHSIYNLFGQVVEHVFSEIQNRPKPPSEAELRQLTDFLLEYWPLSQCDQIRATRLLEQQREILLSGRKISTLTRFRNLLGRVNILAVTSRRAKR